MRDTLNHTLKQHCLSNIMGTLETAARKQRRLRNFEYGVLAAIGIAGILAVIMIAPNLPQALPGLMGRSKYRAKFGYRARTAAGRLAQRGLVCFTERGGRKYAEITGEGRKTLLFEQQRNALKIQKRRRWDKRYRMVVFDIPERRRDTRDRLRSIMHSFGFLRLQDSVWIFPYDCEDVVALIKAELRVGKDVLYVIAEAIENDSWIRRHFHLD